MMCSEEPPNFQLPVFENRFTSNELEELLSFLQSAGNDDETSPDQPVSSNSGSDDPTNRVLEETDEKKKKRKISNRESAKRSRWRKKRHLADLTVQLNQLKAQNRELKNRFSIILYQLHAARSQNERLRFESMRLLQRYSNLNRVLQTMQSIQHKSGTINASKFHQPNVEIKWTV